MIDKEKLTESWQVLNTVAHVSGSFAARTGQKLFYDNNVSTKDNKKIPLNIQHAIMIKEGDDIRKIFHEVPASCTAYPFTRDMLETTNDKKVVETTKIKNDAEVEYLGVLVFGPRNLVEDYTKNNQLF